MIVLYNPVSSASQKPVLPMSLLALGAVLEGEEDYTLVDGNLHGHPDAFLEGVIARTGADILGITVMPGPQLQSAAPISKRLKARFPDLTIIWGGYFPTMYPKPVMAAAYVDYVIRGHGEESFLKLVRAVRRGKVDHTLPGLAWRGPRSGKPRINPTAPIADPDRLPDFPYHRIDMAPYVHPTFMGQRTLSHHSSNGCPFKCNFCGVVNMVDGRWQAQGAERTAAVTSLLVERYGADSIEFHDSNFFVHEARVAEYAERIAPLGIRWWGLGRVDTLLKFSDRTWRLMRDSGLAMIFIGAESGSDEMLALMNKGGRQTADQALELAARMGKYGIVPEYSLVLGNPPEPARDIEDSIRYIRRIKKVNPATEIILYLYSPVPLPGGLTAAAESLGFGFPETLEEWTSAQWHDFAHHTTEDLPWLDDGMRHRISDFQRVLHAAYPTLTDPRASKLGRWALKAAGALRYVTQIYSHPVELRVMARLFPQRRPEVTGF